MSKKCFVETLFKKRSSFNDPDQAEMLANLLDTVSSDIYSESQRFIFELIQNADDAASGNENEIQFDIHSDCLIISHNGRPFDETDINAITHAGKGTKESDQSKTGYKGIGFKSVFGKSDKVHVFTGGYNFRFDKKLIKKSFNNAKMPWQIIPIWTDRDELPESSRTILSNGYNVCTIVELKNTNGLVNDINELLSNGKILLFLRRIVRISVSVNSEPKFSIERKTIKKEKCYNEIAILKNKNETSRWIVKIFENIPIDTEAQYELQQDEKTPDKLKKAKFTDISFAARIEKGRINALKGEESLIFTYLPTKVFDFEFPFLVNGNFLTNTSREAIHEDRFWNQWLFKNICVKVFDWLELLSTSKYKHQILHLLPSRFNSVQNDLKIAFDEALNETIIVKAFIPNKNGTLRIASDILIDKTGLSEEDFIPESALIEFINKVENKSFDNEAFIHSKIELKWKLNNIGSVTFDLENLEVFFTDDLFTSSHKPIDNFNLISFFFEKSNKSESRELNEKLKYIPFVYAEGKNLECPQKLCFPSVDYETDYGEGVTVIHDKVYQKIEAEPRIQSWLESLGVKEPSDIAYIENEIIGNIEDSINESNFLNVTRYLFNQHKKGILKELHYRQLQEIRLFTIKKEFKPANKCYLSDIYEPTLKLEKVNEQGDYVSGKYKVSGDLPSEWKTFFIRIGVTDNIAPKRLSIDFTYRWRERFDSDFLNEVYTISNNYSWVSYKGWTYNNDGYGFSVRSLNIFGLPLLEFTTQYKFSKIFFSMVFSTYEPSEIYSDETFRVEGATGFFYRSISKQMLETQGCPVDYFKWIVENKKIFPTQKKECEKASNILLNTEKNIELAGRFLSVLDCDIVPNEEWTDIIPFKQRLDVADYLTLLDKIAEETEKHEQVKNVNKKRIGLVYNQLSEKLSSLSANQKSQIADWSNSKLLLSESGKFEKSKELKWVKIDGFTNTSEHLKLLFIPENCDSNTSSFQELLRLFGVQIIDSFIPDIKNKVPNATLKIQLQVILPYLTAILERKHFLDYSTQYKRLSKIIDNTKFYSASEIVVSFKNQDEIILGPSLHAYLAESELSFKGKWTSPITLYALVPELLRLFSINDLNEELQVLLQLDESEIEEWFFEQGYDVNAIKMKPEYEISTEKVKMFKQEESIEQTPDKSDISVINELSALNTLLKSKNISVEQLIRFISNFDADETDNNVSFSSKEHLAQKWKNEENRVARELVYQRLISEGFEFAQGIGETSVVNGVFKENIEYPLVVKSYQNTSYKFNIRPNEWIQLSKPNAMFWVHRGNGKLEVLNLEGLLRANSEFHVQFDTAAFSFDGLVKFAEVFRFVKNVHFQLDAPKFSIAKAFDEYRFDKRENGMIEKESDNQELLH